MTSAAEKEATAMGLRRCADELSAAFDGLVMRSRSAWDCPAATAFEIELRSRITMLDMVATELRASAVRLEAAAAAQRAAEEQAVVGLGPGQPAPSGGGGWAPPVLVPVGGPR